MELVGPVNPHGKPEVTMMCDVGVSTVLLTHSETKETVVAACLSIHHPDMIAVLNAIISKEMLEQVLGGLNELKGDVTFSSEVTAVKEDDSRVIN